MPAPDLLPGQSLELLKELHILTRDGQLNQDSRRKLKQVHHLVQFIEPLIVESIQRRGAVTLVDHGAGKSFLGFILHDLCLKDRPEPTKVIGIETRGELVEKSAALAARLGFRGMEFLHLPAAEAATSARVPAEVDVVTALHACDTATDDAIRFALARRAPHVVLVPCCQAEVAALLRANKGQRIGHPLTELYRHPHHTREFGSHLTNVMRCLLLEAHGYQVQTTELVGWEHSMKNELILAARKGLSGKRAGAHLTALRRQFGLEAWWGDIVF